MPATSRRTATGRVTKSRKTKGRRNRRRSPSEPESDEEAPLLSKPPAYPRIQISFDLGTTSNSACFRILTQPDDPHAIIYEVRAIGEANPLSFPSIFWWDQFGNFFTGHQLESRIRRTPIPRDQVITLAKIALYDGPETDAIQAEVRAQLKRFRKSEEQLWRECLKALVSQAFKYIEDGTMYYGIFSPEDIQMMPREFFFTAPHGMDGKSTQPLTKAAHSLNAEVSVIVSEPLALATGLFHHLIRIPKHEADSRQTVDIRKNALEAVEKGLITLFVDVGGGYGVTTAVRYLQAPVDGKTLQMEVISPPETFPCGSMMMNRTFRSWLKNCPQLLKRFGCIERACTELGYREAEFLSHGEFLFEAVKKSFDDESLKYSLVFESLKASDENAWVLKITRRQVEEQMMPTIQLVSDLISRSIDHLPLDANDEVQVPSTIIISGGASQSTLLFENLRTAHTTDFTSVRRWDPSAIACPIPRGALVRRDNDTVRDLATTYNLAILRDERLDVIDPHHKAAFTVVKGKIEPDELLTTPGDHDASEVWVNDCLIWILQDGKELEEVSSDHFPNVGKPFEFEQDIVYSRRANFKDGELLWEIDTKSMFMESQVPSQLASRIGFVKLKKGCIMRQGLSYFACQKWTISAARLRKFGLFTHQDGSQTFAIRIQTRVVLGDGTISIAFKAVDRMGKEGDTEYILDDDVVDAKLEKEQWDIGSGDKPHSIWSAKHSQIPSGGDDMLAF